MSDLIRVLLSVLAGQLLYLAVSEIRNYINDKKQRTFIYCPVCQTELVKHGEILKDDTRIIKYRCIVCGKESKWDIIHYPAPMLIED